MNSSKVILGYLERYLIDKGIPIKKQGTTSLVDCPICGSKDSGTFVKQLGFVHCFKCNKSYNLLHIYRHLENVPKHTIDNQIYKELKERFNINVMLDDEEKELDELLAFYEDCGFSMVKHTKNGKEPFEPNWQFIEHKDASEWKSWLECGLNIGLLTGTPSNCIVIDIEVKDIHPELRKFLPDTLIERTNRGWHYIYQNTPDIHIGHSTQHDFEVLGEYESQFEEGKIIRKAACCSPSIVEGVKRTLINRTKPTLLTKEQIDGINSFIPIKKNSDTITKTAMSPYIISNYKKPLIGKGDGRNDLFLHLGGMLRKQLNPGQVEYTLKMLNKTICKSGEELSQQELQQTIFSSIKQYHQQDSNTVRDKILSYLKDAKSATRQDIEIVVFGEYVKGDNRKELDKVLVQLVQDRIIIKKHSQYEIIEKIEWEETYTDLSIPVKYKMPYFHKYCHFHEGDLIVIGSSVKQGKTTLSQNFIKQFIAQGIRPYYLFNEPAGGWVKTALTLGMMDGKGAWFKEWYKPETVILEPHAVTIYDWVRQENFAETATLFERFAQQLAIKKGIMICFVQLREDDTFFAKDQIKQFPSVISRYVYENENDGTFTKFILDDVRFPKFQREKTKEIPCMYNWETKEVSLIEDQEVGGNTDVSIS